MPTNDPFTHSRRNQITLWITALFIIASGIYLTHIEFMGHEWLSRSGCVIVMLGIWSGLGYIVQESVMLGRLKRQRRNSITRAKARLGAEESDEEKSEQEIDDINQAYDKQADDLTQKLKFSLGVLEVSLLLTGTFLWGFGDLLILEILND